MNDHIYSLKSLISCCILSGLFGAPGGQPVGVDHG